MMTSKDFLVAVLGLSVAAAAAPSSSQTGPQFRDDRTGIVWAPDPVAADNRLNRDNRLEPPSAVASPADRAFDPRAQIAAAEPLLVQYPRVTLMGQVPVTAGPTVPVVTIDGPTLQAVPGDRWLTVLYVTNNSAAAVVPQLGCTFTNAGRAVQEVRAVLPATGPGTRVGVPVYGPRTDLFVDRALCRVLTP